MGREDPQLKLRLTEEMKALIVDEARRNNRSVNAEIVSRLERSFGAGFDTETIAKLTKAYTELAVQTEVSSALRHNLQILVEQVADKLDRADADAALVALKVLGIKAPK